MARSKSGTCKEESLVNSVPGAELREGDCLTAAARREASHGMIHIIKHDCAVAHLIYDE